MILPIAVPICIVCDEKLLFRNRHILHALVSWLELFEYEYHRSWCIWGLH